MENKQEQIMAAFIQWLPKNISKFQGQIPEEIIAPIANADNSDTVVGVLNELSKSKEGNQLVQGIFQVFQKEISGESQMFKKGGKLAQGLSRFQFGGLFQRNRQGTFEAIIDSPKEVQIPIVRKNAPAAADKNLIRVPDLPGIKNRRIGGAVGTDGRQVLRAHEDINGNTAFTTLTVREPGDTLVHQSIARYPDGYLERDYQRVSEEYNKVLKRLGDRGTSYWKALDAASKSLNLK